MGSGHGCTGDGVGGAVASDPGGGDISAGGKDVKDGAKVAVRGPGIPGLGGTDGDGAGSGGGRGVGSVEVVISGGNGKDDTGSDGVVDGGVEGSGESTAQAHVCNFSWSA